MEEEHEKEDEKEVEDEVEEPEKEWVEENEEEEPVHEEWEDDGEKKTVSKAKPSEAIAMLESLLGSGTKRRGRKVRKETTSATKRRVIRKDQKGGLAGQTAALFERIIADVNQEHSLALFPLTLRHIMTKMKAGTPILIQAERRLEAEVMSQAAVDLAADAGGACSRAVLGGMARSNEVGQLSSQRIADLTGYTKSWINKAKRQVENGNMGVYSAQERSGGVGLQQPLCLTRADPKHGHCKLGDSCTYLHDCQCCNNGKQCAACDCENWNSRKAQDNNRRRLNKSAARSHLSEAESEATKKWMSEENPARSGDQMLIYWMNKGTVDFYQEDYRSAGSQVKIIQKALKMYGDELRQAARSPTNRWLRNVKTYLDSIEDNAVETITVDDHRIKSLWTWRQSSRWQLRRNRITGSRTMI